MSLIDDHQVPAGRDEILEALSVVAGQLLMAPTSSVLHGLDGVHRADHLIVQAPEVLGFIEAGELASRCEAARDHEVELLVEVRPHLLDPLGHQPGGSYNKRALHKPPNLEFAKDEPGLDRLAEANLVGEQIADPVSRHRTRQRIDLMGKWQQRAFQWGDQRVALERIGDARGSSRVNQLVAHRALVLSAKGRQPLSRYAHHGALRRQPHPIARRPPQPLPIDNLAGLAGVAKPGPFTGGVHASVLIHLRTTRPRANRRRSPLLHRSRDPRLSVTARLGLG